MRKIWIVGLLIVNSWIAVGGEPDSCSTGKVDPDYIKTCYNDLVVRVFSANKNNFIQFHDQNEEVRLKYRPNDYYNLGIGFNYKWFGLKIGTKIPMLSGDDHRYGKTTSFGLQSYIYSRKFTLDILGIKTRGYYLSELEEEGLEIPGLEQYYTRRDLITSNFGINFNYVVNHRRFSYKAAFKQTDIQLKSAGSMIYGGGVYLITVEADSAFVPSEIGNQYFANGRLQNNFEAYTLNANLGYAYSLVPSKNWIITGSYLFSLGLQQNMWHFTGEDTDHQLKFSWSSAFQLSAGHYFPNFYLGASIVRYQQNSKIQYRDISIMNGTNFMEFTMSKRIQLKRRKSR